MDFRLWRACVVALCGLGCASSPLPKAGESRASLVGRWDWVDAECSDGALQLGSVGLERTLDIAHDPRGDLLFTYDNRVTIEGCERTSVWRVAYAKGGRFAFEPQAFVSLPPGRACGADEREATEGTLRSTGDMLEVVAARSPWCRGFDARFVYRRGAAPRLSPQDIAVRYVAHWNRGDAASVAELFADEGSLVEPFTRTDDGNYARHQGRDQVRAWLDRAFSSAPWLALRLLAVEPGAGNGQWVASWEYMDEHLASPLRGRNLFVIAGGEIFESEVQLLDDPRPKVEAPVQSAQKDPP